jgi:hypothetical protein
MSVNIFFSDACPESKGRCIACPLRHQERLEFTVRFRDTSYGKVSQKRVVSSAC